MVAIPNHHFFQWVNQLKHSGHQVYWFDITDGGPKSKKIEWVQQIKGWKLRWDFPLRTTLKNKLPKVYLAIQTINQNKIDKAFKKAINTIKPDLVHCFEMQLSGLPILGVMEQNNIPLIYSSWGSDVFFYKEKGMTKTQIQSFYNRANYLITDCKRDFNLAKANGFNNTFLGVFPGNGGITIEANNIATINNRNIILIKGYEDGVGKASIVLKALELISDKKLKDKKIIIYSADAIIETQVNQSKKLSALNITIHSRYAFIPNAKVLALMGKSIIHIANSISDGMPNALLEAMAMGAFPIQSNPGKVTEEVITHGKNGFLIKNPLAINTIKNLIETAIDAKPLREKAQEYNINFIQKRYNRVTLQAEITKQYQSIADKHNL